MQGESIYLLMGKQKYILHVYFHLFKNDAENINLFQKSKRIY